MIFLRECSGKVDFISNRQMTNNKNKYTVGKELVDFSTLHLSKVFFQLYEDLTSFGPRSEKTCLRGLANNTGADQPAHPRSLISVCYLLFGKHHM